LYTRNLKSVLPQPAHVDVHVHPGSIGLVDAVMLMQAYAPTSSDPINELTSETVSVAVYTCG
jgi:hypothetical protein